MPASSQQSPTSSRRSAWLAALAVDADVVDPGPVQLLQAHPARWWPARAAPGCGADHGHVAVLAEVERQRQAPVALAADAPVAHVAQPVLHPLAVLRRRPLDAAGGLDHRLAHLVAADEPLVHQPVDQLGAAAPADGVAVGDLARLDHPAPLPQVLDDLLRGVAGVAAVQPAEALVEGARLVHRHDRGQALAHAQLEVLGAAAGRDVDDARALVHRDLVPADNAVLDPVLGGQLVERPVVPQPDQLRTLDGADLTAVQRHVLEAALGDVGDARAGLDARIVGVGLDRRRDVGRQRPGRGRPHHQELAVAAGQRQTDVERGVADLAVGVDQLVLGERGAAARAPRHRAMALVQPAAIVALLEEAPDVADVRVGHREVAAVPVHPLAQPSRLLRLDARVLGHAVAAGAREAVEPVLLDLGLGVEPQRLLDLDLDPQPLAVEAVLVALVAAQHGVVALPDVLQRAAPGVVHAHRVVGRDRAVEERVGGAAAVLVAELLEGALALPAIEGSMLELDVIGLLGDGREALHPADSTRRQRGHDRTSREAGAGRRLVLWSDH